MKTSIRARSLALVLVLIAGVALEALWPGNCVMAQPGGEGDQAKGGEKWFAGELRDETVLLRSPGCKAGQSFEVEETSKLSFELESAGEPLDVLLTQVRTTAYDVDVEEVGPDGDLTALTATFHRDESTETSYVADKDPTSSSSPYEPQGHTYRYALVEGTPDATRTDGADVSADERDAVITQLAELSCSDPFLSRVPREEPLDPGTAFDVDLDAITRVHGGGVGHYENAQLVFRGTRIVDAQPRAIFALGYLLRAPDEDFEIVLEYIGELEVDPASGAILSTRMIGKSSFSDNQDNGLRGAGRGSYERRVVVTAPEPE